MHSGAFSSRLSETKQYFGCPDAGEPIRCNFSVRATDAGRVIMPLVFTGKLTPGGLNDSAFEAYDGGQRIVVVVTKDAETDFGFARAGCCARQIRE